MISEDQDNVVILDRDTRLAIPPDRVLKSALNELDTVILIGKAKDGTRWHASSISNTGTMLYMIERFKEHLLAESE